MRPRSAAAAGGGEPGSRRPDFDALVVGAGPAGSSLAARLAATGHRVGLLDARTFPRSKPCGDAVSPGATPLLRELGVWDEIRSGPESGAALDRWRIRAHDGSWFEGRFSGDVLDSPAWGLALDRARLDHALLRRAQDHGTVVFERTRAFGLVERGGRVAGVRVRDREGRERTVTARFVVGADGLRSRVARLLGGVRRGRRRRLGLVARFEDVVPASGQGELRLSAGGVLGYAPISATACNVTVIVAARRAAEIQGDPLGFVLAAVTGYGAHERVAGGRAVRPVEVTGPFEAYPTRRTAPGALLVGDAAGYFDPFTGQGVYRALLGARFAAVAIRRGLDDPTCEAEALADYERALDRELRPARGLQRLLDLVVSRPGLMNAGARLLRSRTGLADRLVDATGDRLAPAELRTPGGWIGALRGRSPRSETAASRARRKDPRAHA